MLTAFAVAVLRNQHLYRATADINALVGTMMAVTLTAIAPTPVLHRDSGS
jgi:hypothetical protein